MDEDQEMYYAVVYAEPAGLFVVETNDIYAIIASIQNATRDGFKVRVSPNTHDKLVEMQREAARQWN